MSRIRPISDIPPLVVDSIEEFEKEMKRAAKARANQDFLDECREIAKRAWKDK